MDVNRATCARQAQRAVEQLLPNSMSSMWLCDKQFLYKKNLSLIAGRQRQSERYQTSKGFALAIVPLHLIGAHLYRITKETMCNRISARSLLIFAVPCVGADMVIPVSTTTSTSTVDRRSMVRVDTLGNLRFTSGRGSTAPGDLHIEPADGKHVFVGGQNMTQTFQVIDALLQRVDALTNQIATMTTASATNNNRNDVSYMTDMIQTIDERLNRLMPMPNFVCIGTGCVMSDA
jgi:hypothetical protein